MSANQMKNGNNQQNYIKKQVGNMPNKAVEQKNGQGNVLKINKKQDDDKSSNRKVFVGGLTSNTTKEDLIEYFSKFGGVEDANIKMDTGTGRSKGYGFVLFESKEVADQVLATNEHNIMGKVVDVKTAKYKGVPPVKKVFIGGLDPNFPESELREYFSKYGKIEEIELPFDKQKNQRRSFCFILFESEDSVNEILKKPKHVLGGKEVDVKKATPPKDQNQQNAILQPQWNQFQNWNAMGGNYFPTDSSVPGYGAQGFGGVYNAPNSFGGQQSVGYNSQAATSFNKYNYQQSNVNGGGYAMNYNENFEAGGYVDYDDPNTYDYSAAGAYDPSGFYSQNNQVNAPYGEYYDQNMYGNYDQYGQPPAAATTTAAASAHPPSTSSSSSKGHHSYGKISKRSSQSQSYHPYNR